MKKFSIKYTVVASAAAKSGKTVEQYVSDLATLSCGRGMCAHLDEIDGETGIAIFSFA